MGIQINFHVGAQNKKKLLVRYTSVVSDIILPSAKRVDPDQAALTRSESALFVKALKGVYMS